MTDRGKNALKLGAMGLFLICAAWLGLTLASTALNPAQALAGLLQGDKSSAGSRILLYVRLPRVCASLLAGAALAASGMLIQGALGNPLAAPNVIGVNAGAGFFTLLAMAAFPGVRGAAPTGAFLGALAATGGGRGGQADHHSGGRGGEQRVHGGRERD